MGEPLRKFLLTVLALILPPVAVYIRAGHHWQLYVNIFFCLLFYIPAVLHAIWFVRHHPGPDSEEFDYTNPDEEENSQQAAANRRLSW